MTNNRLLIAISNDDGYYAKGIQELIKLARTFGDVICVAPDGPRSAQSSALSLNVPISLKEVADEPGYMGYLCSGTPADCMKLMLNSLCKDRKPGLVLSGINHGSNASINVLYSGTMGATFEGLMHGIPSIGLSLCSHDDDANLDYCLPYFAQIIERVIAQGLPPYTCLNVNAPYGPNLKGIKICQQAQGSWKREFSEAIAPRDIPYYWLTGSYEQMDKENDRADQTALDQHYISVVPVRIDLTNYEAIPLLEFLVK